jgi:LacI family transcriptional regulator
MVGDGRSVHGVDGRRGGNVTTIKEVARQAGVAPSSVTRVLNGHPHVSDELAGRVFKAVEKLGYRPDLMAAGLRRGTSQTVGVIVSDIINPSIAQLVDVLEIALRSAGYGVLLASSHGDPAMDVESVELLRQRRIDGLVVMCVDESRPDLRAALTRWGGPTVLVDRQIDDFEDASAVLSSHRQGAFRLTSHLLELGHRHIGYVDGGQVGERFVWRERLAGVRQGYEEHDLRFDATVLQGPRATAQNGRRATAELLDRSQPPTAIVVAPNLMLSGAIQEMRSRRLAVGTDMALACLDDVPVAALHQPAITAVRRDIGEVGRTASSLLLSHMKQSSTRPRTVVLPSELVVRESTTGYVFRAEDSSPDGGRAPESFAAAR